MYSKIIPFPASTSQQTSYGMHTVETFFPISDLIFTPVMLSGNVLTMKEFTTILLPVKEK